MRAAQKNIRMGYLIILSIWEVRYPFRVSPRKHQSNSRGITATALPSPELQVLLATRRPESARVSLPAASASAPWNQITRWNLAQPWGVVDAPAACSTLTGSMNPSPSEKGGSIPMYMCRWSLQNRTLPYLTHKSIYRNELEISGHGIAYEIVRQFYTWAGRWRIRTSCRRRGATL